MANIIETVLTITGNKEAMGKFVDFLGPDEIFSLNKIVPMPEALDIPQSNETEEALVYILALKYLAQRDRKLKFIPPIYLKALDSRGIKGIWDVKLDRPKALYGERNFLEMLQKADKLVDRLEWGPEARETKVPTSEECVKTQAQFIALGERAVSNIRDYGAITWYEWRIKNWGCKWDVSPASVGIVIGKDSARVSFNTPWNPPIPALVELSKSIPGLKIKGSSIDEECRSNSTWLSFTIMNGEVNQS